MKKILIIGQAPPVKEQKVPYDSTLLYEMLSWVGITKEQAQDMFEFEAVSPTLRGVKNGNHLKPLKHEIHNHVVTVLGAKMKEADKILLMGNVAIENVIGKKHPYGMFGTKYALLPHPSRRNYNLIMKQKESITNLLKEVLQPL